MQLKKPKCPLPSEKGVWGCLVSGEEGVGSAGRCVWHLSGTCLALLWHCAVPPVAVPDTCPQLPTSWRGTQCRVAPASVLGRVLPSVVLLAAALLFFWAALAPPSAGQRKSTDSFFFLVNLVLVIRSPFTDGYNAARYLLSTTNSDTSVIPVISLDVKLVQILLRYRHTRWSFIMPHIKPLHYARFKDITNCSRNSSYLFQ